MKKIVVTTEHLCGSMFYVLFVPALRKRNVLQKAVGFEPRGGTNYYLSLAKIKLKISTFFQLRAG